MSYENKTQEFNDRVKEILGLSDIEKLKKIVKGNYGLEAVYATFSIIKLNGTFKLPDFDSLIILPDQPLFSELSQDELYDAFLSYMELEKESKFGHPTHNYNIIFDDIEIPIDLVIVYYLTDQLHLKNVVLNVYNMFTQLAALTKITSQTVLGELFIERVKIPQVKEALRLVNEELTLAKIAIERKNFAIGYYCEPDDEHNHEWNYGVRADAVQRISDQNTLKNIVKKACYRDVRLLSLEKITDVKILGELIKYYVTKKISYEDNNVCEKITKKLIDAIGSDYWSEFDKIDVLTDQKILAAIAIFYPEPAPSSNQCVSEKAARNVTDKSLLKKIIELTTNMWAWQNALERITDESYLEKIAVDYRDTHRGWKVSERIKNLQQHA